MCNYDGVKTHSKRDSVINYSAHDCDMQYLSEIFLSIFDKDIRCDMYNISVIQNEEGYR